MCVFIVLPDLLSFTYIYTQLLPESWGFLCPVHTPDGAPCGLLNHLAAKCKVIDTIYIAHDYVGVISHQAYMLRRYER